MTSGLGVTGPSGVGFVPSAGQHVSVQKTVELDSGDPARDFERLVWLMLTRRESDLPMRMYRALAEVVVLGIGRGVSEPAAIDATMSDWRTSASMVRQS